MAGLLAIAYFTFGITVASIAPVVDLIIEDLGETPEEGGEDVFAHFSAITMDGYKTLKKGQTVEFDCTQGPKGMHATAIKPKGASENLAPH